MASDVSLGPSITVAEVMAAMTPSGRSVFIVRRGVSGLTHANFDVDFTPHVEVGFKKFFCVVEAFTSNRLRIATGTQSV